VSLVGFAVAGGRSRRMGRDKALLRWGETDLLGHAITRLRAVTEDVRILSGGEPRYSDRGVPVEVDPAPDLGPLGGLAAALDAASGDDVLLLGIDLPLIPSALLTRLVELVPGFDAAVPVSARGPEPLCAFYGAACQEPVRRRIASGDLRMTAFWTNVRVREVGPSELRAFGDPEELFLNVNAPADFERAQALSAGR
jgi:molybdopterin-guanine dinucleotide biosynthesis protein A